MITEFYSSHCQGKPYCDSILYGAKVLFVLATFFLMSACATRPPSSTDNLCSIFEEKRNWYKAAKKSQSKWGSPIPIMMSFIHQESKFKSKAKPPRRKLLWVLPGPRLSSAYGYPQAKTSTWKWYIKETGNRGADRDDFKDAIDFVGWYNARSSKTNNIQNNDPYNLYLAYHEGHGGFNRRTFSQKKWLTRVANKVTDRSNRYSQQLNTCSEKLDKDGWWIF